MDKQGNLALPIQEDETALVVYSLWQHYTLFHEIEFIRPLYRPLIKAAADFMCAFREPFTGCRAVLGSVGGAPWHPCLYARGGLRRVDGGVTVHSGVWRA